jgi:hypothetical protein
MLLVYITMLLICINIYIQYPILYQTLLIVYNTFSAQPEDGSITAAETCFCYEHINLSI